MSEVTFDDYGEADGSFDAIHDNARIAQIDKGRTSGRPSQSWRARLDRTAPGYMVRYGQPDEASVMPEKWFATLEEAQQWITANAPRPMRVGGDVRWVVPS